MLRSYGDKNRKNQENFKFYYLVTQLKLSKQASDNNYTNNNPMKHSF